MNCFSFGGFKICGVSFWVAVALALVYFAMNKGKKQPARIQSSFDIQQWKQSGCQTSGQRPAVLTGYQGNYPTEACAVSM